MKWARNDVLVFAAHQVNSYFFSMFFIDNSFFLIFIHYIYSLYDRWSLVYFFSWINDELILIETTDYQNLDKKNGHFILFRVVLNTWCHLHGLKTKKKTKKSTQWQQKKSKRPRKYRIVFLFNNCWWRSSLFAINCITRSFYLSSRECDQSKIDHITLHRPWYWFVRLVMYLFFLSLVCHLCVIYIERKPVCPKIRWLVTVAAAMVLTEGYIRFRSFIAHSIISSFNTNYASLPIIRRNQFVCVVVWISQSIFFKSWQKKSSGVGMRGGNFFTYIFFSSLHYYYICRQKHTTLNRKPFSIF